MLEYSKMNFDDQPPSYEEVIERFGLSILKEPGDLVVKNGNIAVTKVGNLMLNSAEYTITVMVWTAPAGASGSQGSRAKMVVVEQPLEGAPSTPSL
jgi:hypothetical protein